MSSVLFVVLTVAFAVGAALFFGSGLARDAQRERRRDVELSESER